MRSWLRVGLEDFYPAFPATCVIRAKTSAFEACSKSVFLLRAKQIKHAGYDPRPSSLVTRPQASAVVSMEIFVEQNVIFPVRVLLKLVGSSVHWTLATGIGQSPAVGAGALWSLWYSFTL
jgi:hypothetical protein